MIIEKEFEIIYSYNLTEDKITLQELIAKRKELLESRKITFENKEYSIIEVFLKEDTSTNYKMIIQVSDDENKV
ncbi:hypothetical protein [uncultured Fusobacterium sp.]|uniref:hypothetical protein n=1 Tax=uncultured Fusobacterium sp. TaxID=159267 RepID=UPI0025E5CD81|nr:hypothetical protein [uncultured Fusobacterium sp.]